MCRNIKTLFNFDPPVTDDEIRAASLQFVRKISGFNKPSKANEAAFRAAIEDVASVSTRFLRSLATTAPPKTAKKKPPKRGLAPPSDFGPRRDLLTLPGQSAKQKQFVTNKKGWAQEPSLHHINKA